MRVLALAVLLILLVATMEQTTTNKGRNSRRPRAATGSKVPSDKLLRTSLGKCSGSKCGSWRWCYYSGCFYSACPRYRSTFSIGQTGYYFGYINNPPHKTPIKGVVPARFLSSRQKCGANYYKLWIYQRAPCSRLLIKSPRNCIKNCVTRPYHTWNDRYCRC